MTISAARLAPVTMDLDVLLRRVARRDADAFAAFYDATRSRVFGLVTRVLRDRGYSEETTQEVYLQVWRSAETYDPTAGSALAWLMTLAHRRAVDRVRSEQAAGKRESRYGAMSVDTPLDDANGPLGTVGPRPDCRRSGAGPRSRPRRRGRPRARSAA